MERSRLVSDLTIAAHVSDLLQDSDSEALYGCLQQLEKQLANQSLEVGIKRTSSSCIAALMKSSDRKMAAM